jgi:hypothetical protein
MKRINLNTVLAVLGGLAVFAPDVAALASVLQGWGVTWLAVPIRVLGAAALLLSSLPRIIGRLRPLLAALNLASPSQTDDPPAAHKGPGTPCWLLVFVGAAVLLSALARPARADEQRWTYGVTASVLLVGGQATLWRPAP